MKFFYIIGYIDRNTVLDSYIQSLLDINYSDYQIIIIDDSIIIDKNKYSPYKNINKMTFISQKGHRGIYNCLNYCLKTIDTEYILITTGDIRLNSNILKYLNTIINKTNESVYEYKFNNNYTHKFLNICFHKKILDDVGYFDTYNKYSDWDFYMRIKKIYTIHKIDLIMGNIIGMFNLDTRSIKFKKTMLLSTRLHIKYNNYLKYIDSKFYPEIYSPLDIIIKEVSDTIKCYQYITIYDKGDYQLFNNLAKTAISIIEQYDNKNIKIINTQSIYLTDGLYIITYAVNVNVNTIKPIILNYLNI